MDLLLTWLNAAACGLISLALVAAILSPKVHDGIVVKVGLISMAAGFGAIALRLLDGVRAHEVVGLERALLMVNAGIAVVIVGYLLRRARAHHPIRRSTDWAELDEPAPIASMKGHR